MQTLTQLSDEELLQATLRCANEERAVTLHLLRHIDEVDRRKLYLAKGYPSLFEFVRDWLKIPEGSAWRRIASMKLLRDEPGVAEKIQSGALPLTTAALIHSATKGKPAETRAMLLKECEGKSFREVERAIAENQPEELKEYTRWLSGEQVRVTVHLDRETFIALSELKAIRSHAATGRTYGGIIGDLIELGHQEWNPLKRSATPTLESQRVNKDRRIPSSTRTQIWQRDGGACTYTDPVTGKRCGSNHYLQLDHIHPVALGGTNAPENLRLLCGQHNRWRAEKTFGPRPPPAN